MTTFDRGVGADSEPLSPWDPVPDVVEQSAGRRDGTDPDGEEHGGRAPRGRRRQVGRLVAVLVVATVLGLVVVDVLVGRLAFATRQDHWASDYNDPTVARPDRGAPTLVLQVEDQDVNLVIAEGSSADILRGGPGLMGGSPLPGEPGNAVVLGRSSRFGAPFDFLADTAEGTTIIVRQKAGQVARFEVTDVTVVEEDDFDEVVGEGVTIEGAPEDEPATLTLVTSAGGPLDSRRRVVTAELTGLSPDGAVAVAPEGDAAASTTTTTPSAPDDETPAESADEEVLPEASSTDVVRDPGRRPDSFDVRSPSVVITLLAGLVVVGLAAAAIPELRRRHSTATVVVVVAPAIALGVVLALLSLDAVLPVTY